MAKNATLQEITAQIEQLQRQAELLRAKHKKPVITAINQAMTQYGKYRNPKTGETWSGRGRTARWIAEAEREGKSRDKFLIR